MAQQKLQVGWQTITDENDEYYGKIRLFTTFKQAEDILYKHHKIEFRYASGPKCLTAIVDKLPKDKNIKYYEEFAVNTPTKKPVRTAMQQECVKLAQLDRQKNKLKDKLAAVKEQIDEIEEQEAGIKQRIFTRLMDHGHTVKRGRWYHRALMTDWFRVFSYSVFAEPILNVDLDHIRGLAKRFKKWRNDLESTIKPDMVQIEPEVYEKIKDHIPKSDQNKVHVSYEVDEGALTKLIPKLPYSIYRLLWIMRSPIDEDGNPIYTIHPQTNQKKNADCKECGGDFKKDTNQCKECGQVTLIKDPKKKNQKQLKAPKKELPKKRTPLWLGSDTKGKTQSISKKASPRKVPKAGQSRYYEDKK